MFSRDKSYSTKKNLNFFFWPGIQTSLTLLTYFHIQGLIVFYFFVANCDKFERLRTFIIPLMPLSRAWGSWRAACSGSHTPAAHTSAKTQAHLGTQLGKDAFPNSLTSCFWHDSLPEAVDRRHCSPAGCLRGPLSSPCHCLQYFAPGLFHTSFTIQEPLQLFKARISCSGLPWWTIP